MDRILRGKPATLETQFFDARGEQSVDAGTVTVTVTRDDGTDILTDAATTKDTDPVSYTVDLTADHTDELDRLTVTWTSPTHGVQTTHVEIVGALYANVPDIRDQAGLDDQAKHSTARILEARSEVETRVEVATGLAWVPRYGAETHVGSGRDELQLARTGPVQRILSAVETDTNGDDTTLDTTDWTVDPVTGLVTRDPGSFSASFRYRIVYEHGHDTPPADLRRAALAAIRYLLTGEVGGLSGAPPSRATSLDTEFGSYRLQMADTDDRPFGHDQIDSVIMRHADDGPVFASDTLLDMTPLG